MLYLPDWWISVKNWSLYASNCWTWLSGATNHAFSSQLACDLPTAPTRCADVTQLRMLDLDAGKDRQVMSWSEFCTSWSASMLCYNDWRARGVCALESSSLCIKAKSAITKTKNSLVILGCLQVIAFFCCSVQSSHGHQPSCDVLWPNTVFQDKYLHSCMHVHHYIIM